MEKAQTGTELQLECNIKEQIEKVVKLLMSKFADYGPDNITQGGLNHIIGRLNDKICRMKNLNKCGDPLSPQNETMEDTFMDTVGYGILGLLHLEERYVNQDNFNLKRIKGSPSVLGNINFQFDNINNMVERHDKVMELMESQAKVRLDNHYLGDHHLGKAIKCKPKNRMVYLAGPIDITKMDGKQNIKECIRNKGFAIYDPAEAFVWNLEDSSAEQIRDINWNALETCDTFILVIKKGQASIGCPMELMKAKELGKAIRIVTDIEHSVYLSEFRNAMHPDITSALDSLHI